MSNNTKKRKIFVDLATAVCFLAVLAFQLTGGMPHEWIGIGFCALLGIHLVLNRRWFTTLHIGRYGFRRLFSSMVTSLLIIWMTAVCVTGLLNAKYVLPFPELAGGMNVAKCTALPHTGE